LSTPGGTAAARVGDAVPGRGLALSHLDGDVAGGDGPEGVLVGAVVAEVDRRDGAEVVAQPQQCGALVGVGDRELEHLLARLLRQ
jgi:hypothetical protein